MPSAKAQLALERIEEKIAQSDRHILEREMQVTHLQTRIDERRQRGVPIAYSENVLRLMLHGLKLAWEGRERLRSLAEEIAGS